MSEIDFMGYKCSFHVDTDKKIHYEHNIRDPQLVQHEKHINPNEYSEVTLNYGKLNEAYETIFGDAVNEYNRGLRKDRQIKNYLELIRKDGRRGQHLNQKADGSRKPAYEAIIQIGNRDSHPSKEESIRILKLFVEKWIPKHYQNIKPILIAYHGDEFSIDRRTKQRIESPVHCHFDFIYLAHCLSPEELKEEKIYRQTHQTKNLSETELREDMIKRTGKSLTKGMSIQSSMSSALLEMGFKTGNGTTAQIQFEEQVRHDLQDFAEGMGLKIDRTPGERHKHDEKSVYQEKQDLKKEKKEWIKRTNKVADVISEKQKEIIKIENDITSTKNALKKREVNISTKEKSLNERENKVTFRENQITANNLIIESYEQTIIEVNSNKIMIDELKNDFFKTEKTDSLKNRINTFTSGCKKIVTSIGAQLSKYKQAFQNFWKYGPKQFRELADNMEQEGCANYEMYFEKKRHGMFKEQIEKKRKLLGKRKS